MTKKATCVFSKEDLYKLVGQKKIEVGSEHTVTRADALSRGRALASAGFVIYAGNHQGSLVQ